MCIRDRANVSHELRTPLTAIQGYADTLLDVDDAPETRRKFINIIRKHASRMVRLVEDLLTLSRLENGEGMSEGEELSLIHIFNGWAATKPYPWMCASWPPPTAILCRKSRRAVSVRICTTASTW